MKYDVAVIGAGPAGATAARFLSQSGLTVALVEKEDLPRDKPCGGALSLQHLKRFKYLEGKMDAIGGVSILWGQSILPIARNGGRIYLL